MPIAEIAGGIILTLGIVAFWRVLLPVTGVLLLVAAAISYGYTSTSRQAGAREAAVGEASREDGRHDEGHRPERPQLFEHNMRDVRAGPYRHPRGHGESNRSSRESRTGAE